MQPTAPAEPTFTKVRARDVKPYHYGLWSSVQGGKPFCNTICHVRWSEDGKTLFFGLDSHNFYEVAPDEIVDLVAEDDTFGRALRDKYESWTLPEYKPGPTKFFEDE